MHWFGAFVVAEIRIEAEAGGGVEMMVMNIYLKS